MKDFPSSPNTEIGGMFKSEEWLRMDRGKPEHVGLSNTAGKALASGLPRATSSYLEIPIQREKSARF